MTKDIRALVEVAVSEMGENIEVADPPQSIDYACSVTPYTSMDADGEVDYDRVKDIQDSLESMGFNTTLGVYDEEHVLVFKSNHHPTLREEVAGRTGVSL